MSHRFSWVVTAWLCVPVLAVIERAYAEDQYPTHTIQIIVPFPPGGALDAATRILAPRLSKVLGVPIVIVSKPGASGAVGIHDLLGAPADGYTIASTSSATLALMHLYAKDVNYTYNDFSPLGNFAVDVSAVIVHTQSPLRSMDELFARAKGGSPLSYAASGVGSVNSLAMQVIDVERGLNCINVPFRGSPEVNMAVLGQQVDFGSAMFSSVIPLLGDDKLRVLAISGAGRLQKFPSIPTFREIGLPDADLSLKVGLYASAKTPRPIVERLSTALSIVMQDPEVSDLIERDGLFMKYEDVQAATTALAKEDRDLSNLALKLKIVP